MSQLQSKIIKTELIEWRKLKFLQNETFKAISDGAREKLRESIRNNNFIDPFKVWKPKGSKTIYCLDGFHRWRELELLANEMGVPDLLPGTFVDCESKEEAAKLVLVYSSHYAGITDTGLSAFIQQYGLSVPELSTMISIPNVSLYSMYDSSPENTDETQPNTLQGRFLVPPFSVLDTRQGYWQTRKREWEALGFNSQATREDVDLIAKSGQGSHIYELRNKMRKALDREPTWDEILAEAEEQGIYLYLGASVFDPVLCELMYYWFCPPGGEVLDVFAGGSVRGVVAGVLGYKYTGIDLRADQVKENQQQASVIKQIKEQPMWIEGDSLNVNNLLPKGKTYKFFFSCPPYGDLEKYSEDPADLSNMDYEDFKATYREIIIKGCTYLEDNCFACFVVSEIRDKNGAYRNFVGHTIQAFLDAGLVYYNDIDLINVAGSLPIRVGRMFKAGRKVGRMHQNVLVFWKGKDMPKQLWDIEIAKLETDGSE